MEAELIGVPHHPACLDDVMTARKCAEALNRHYPGHLWAVHVDSDGGMVFIRNLLISTVYGYRLHLSRVNGDPDLSCVMRAGGEILERGRMNRGGFKSGLDDLIESCPVTVDGIDAHARRW